MAPVDGQGRVPLVEVIVTEELDLDAVPRLNATLVEALELRPAQLVVDLADCPRIDAAGIGLLLQVHRQARRVGGALILRGPSPKLRRNLQLARADRVLVVTPSLDQAPPPTADADVVDRFAPNAPATPADGVEETTDAGD